MADQQDFADSVTQHLPFLNRIVRSLLRRNEMTEDVVQETVLKALTHADQFRFDSTLKTWLASIALNEVRQSYRREWRKRTVPLIIEILEADKSRTRELAEGDYEANERDLLVRHAVSRLPDTYRSVVELCDLQRVPMKEAARKLGLSLPTVKSRRHRARQKLRSLVAKLARRLT